MSLRQPPSFSHVPVLALVGNPNTGKTTLFNALSGLHQRVGNYPGVTVETKKGGMNHEGRHYEIIDLPGTYSLAPRSPDEMVAVDVILGQQAGEGRPDVVVSIVDASNLERNLYLTTQVLELGVPVVIALNMVDVAEAQGLKVDAVRLEKQLGVPVVAIQANKGRGLDALKLAIAAAAARGSSEQGPVFPPAFEREVAALQQHLGTEIPPFLARRLLLDVGGYTEQRFIQQAAESKTNGQHEPACCELKELLQSARQRLVDAGCAVPAVEARTRYQWIRQATAGCVQRPLKRVVTWTDRLDRLLTHHLWGTLIFLLVMFLVFQSIFQGAQPLMDWISAGKDTLAELLQARLPRGPLSSLLVNGILEGVGQVVVFLPQIVILFGFIAVLEDCGYMARAAFLMDKLMSRCGLSGKSFIPMLSSVACAVPGILAARVIENRRDRLTTILVAPLMSCSARLPLYILLIAAFLPVRDADHPDGYAWWVPGVTMFALYGIGLVVAPLVAWLLKRTLLRGEPPLFVLEMPMYKVPCWRTILRRMTDSGWAFLRRAGTFILASMVIVWLALYLPCWNQQGEYYEALIGAQEDRIAQLRESPEPAAAEIEAAENRIHDLEAEWKSQSIFGRLGHALEPVVRPLGWNDKIGTAVLASFPAREVVVATLGLVYHEGRVDTKALRDAENAGDMPLGRKLRQELTLPAALALLVFFALCCQCASTLAVIRSETRSWSWPAFTFIYMTALAYLGALVTYQLGSRLV